MASLVQRGTSLEACLTAAAQQLRNCANHGKKKLQSFSVISKASYSNFVPGTAFCFRSQQKTGLSFVPAMTHTPAARLPFMQDIYNIVM